MKTLTTLNLLVAMLLALPQWMSAQIFNGDLTLTTQAQVDAFSYTEVTGTLTISKSVSSLQPLSSLIHVGSNLNISNNTALRSLQGLENLISIGGDLNISSNSDEFNNLQGMENLTKIGGDFKILNNDIERYQGFENLISISGSLQIYDTYYVDSMEGLNSLTSIGKDLILGAQLGVALDNLQTLNNLASIGGSLIIRNILTFSFVGLENITSINGSLIIGGDRAGWGTFSFEGLENLTSIGGDLGIYVINFNNFQGLHNLTSIGGNFDTQIVQFTSFTGLENLITIEGDLSLYYDSYFSSFEGLENLTSINGTLILAGNPQIASLEGLNHLSSVNNFQISGINRLTDLQGLESLSAIGSSLQIKGNKALESLQGLENLQAIKNITVQNNPLLNDCCAIADLVSKATGTKTISNNSSNCNSVEIIQENCGLAITGFTLVNADTDQDISDLNPHKVPEVINILKTGDHLNIRANTSPATVGSVVFALDGKIIRTENTKPYALFGDIPSGNYNIWTPTFPLRRYTLTATPYEGKNATGKKGKPLTVEFVVINQPLAVTSFTLIATTDNSDQMELKEGSKISLEAFDFTGLNIRANTYGAVKSVVFGFAGKKNFRTESVAPFALGGDSPSGNYLDVVQLKKAGKYQLIATPYSMSGGKGEAGMPLTITFEVVKNLIATARTISATSSNSKAVGGKVEDLSVIQDGAQVWVYPNPADDVLQVQVAGLQDNQSPVTLILYNPLGKKVWEGTAAANHTASIEVSHLSGGVYYLKALGNGYARIQRILVK